MTPEAAVARLAKIIARWDDFTQDEVYDAMADAGIPDRVADRAYKFTQTAWGRLIVGTMGAYCSPNYQCHDRTSGATVSGLLADQPFYAAAMRLAPRYVGSPGFVRLASMSADVNAVKKAVRAGSKAGDLFIGPAILFVE